VHGGYGGYYEKYSYIQGMSNTLYIKFLMRRLIKHLQEKNYKKVDKLIQEIMEELDR
jgi:hypothetical protein